MKQCRASEGKLLRGFAREGVDSGERKGWLAEPKLTRTITRERRLVGMPRFELGTSCTPSRRATRLRYIPSRLALTDFRGYLDKPKRLVATGLRHGF